MRGNSILQHRPSHRPHYLPHQEHFCHLPDLPFGHPGIPGPKLPANLFEAGLGVHGGRLDNFDAIVIPKIEVGKSAWLSHIFFVCNFLEK